MFKFIEGIYIIRNQGILRPHKSYRADLRNISYRSQRGNIFIQQQFNLQIISSSESVQKPLNRPKIINLN